MFLKTLTLKGFKSFADSTELELEPGVTVVVGPNGSGKSNVVDAIAWVLGAQAPTAVRSQKMDDVIFAGTAQRAPLGRAEVSLTIDNGAGVLPIEFTEVTVTRTLFRSGESEYALNGVPCRLLDIQELLSDSGVGRQQHVIISQGQIDGVLNARPEDRRAIIEEAAGVLKYRRRKEKAERRLTATEGNLSRLSDLLREVRRQLRPLERQADAARRHGDVVAELRALRIHAAGLELGRMKGRLERSTGDRRDLEGSSRELVAELATLDTAIVASESELAAMGADDLGDALGRCESLAQRGIGLGELLTERGRGIERERDAFVDEALVATLTSDRARVVAELEEVERIAAASAPELAALADAEADLARRRAEFELEWSDDPSVPDAEAAEVRGELVALRASVEASRGDLGRTDQRIARLRDGREQTLAAQDEASTQVGEADALLRREVDDLDRRTAVSETAQRDAVAAADALQQAKNELRAWESRVEALNLAIDDARSRAGIERLADLSGVLGTLRDLVDVDSGWEAAFEAAAGEALDAMIVDGVESGTRALEILQENALAGAVLPLTGRRMHTVPLSTGDAVRSHVRGRRAEVDLLLDSLIGLAVVVEGGWTEAVRTALAKPDVLVVTRSGDRFGSTGWRVGAAGSGATVGALDEARAETGRHAALVNRLDLVAIEKAGTADGAKAALGEARERVRIAEIKHREAADDLRRVESRGRELDAEVETLEGHRRDLEARMERDGSRVTELQSRVPELEAAEAELLDAGRAMGVARVELEEQATTVGALRTDLEVRAGAASERRELMEARLAELDARLTRYEEKRQEAEYRQAILDRRLHINDRLAGHVSSVSVLVDDQLTQFRRRRQAQSDAARAVATKLDGIRGRRSELEKRLTELRERERRAELEHAEQSLRLESHIEMIRRDLEVEPEATLDAPCPELGEGVTVAARVRELERDLKLMGPINPLALEEFEALQERHEFLQEQLDDVRSSRRELTKVIRAIDAEIVNVFRAAFVDVSQNFSDLFSTLFPGGEGSLQLTEPDDLLLTGIEIQARPSGKNVKKLSLLSGGERSLTALAYLFAVFRSRPSPFYVMDEVEAALDDVNLHRFLQLVDDFRQDAQLMIVSHQKRTMEAADVLYGVTMQPGGSSRVVAERQRADIDLTHDGVR